MEIKDITIDKMAVVGHLHSDFSYALQKLVNEPHVRIKGTPSTDFIEGQFFFYGETEPVYYSYDNINSSAMGKRNFRMEFNPSKINSEQVKWLKDNVLYILDDVGITRLDLAFDCDFDLSTYTFEFKNSLKSSVFRGRTGKIETMYHGSRNSDAYYRIYDKKLELHEKQDIVIDDPILWRFEVELKNAHFIENMIDFGLPVFDDKRIIQYDIDSLPVNDALMITGLLEKPELMGKLTKYGRTKYRKMMKSLNGNDVTSIFKAELDKKKPELIGEINSWRKISASVV